MRSSVTRRIRVRRSAGAAGVSACDSSFARMNASMGLRAQVLLTTAGGLRPDRRGEGPMLLPRRALGNPALQRVDLFGGQSLVRKLGRHPARFVCLRDPLNEQTGIRLARDDWRSRLSFGECAFAGIQPQTRHARRLVRTVAVEAVIRKNRTNFALEINCGETGRCETGS